jgi:ketosteroid isomerase-like protein
MTLSPDHDFARFMKERERISNDYIAGDAEALHPLLTDEEAVTFFPPSGQTVQGPAEVEKSYDDGAKQFRPGSTGAFEILQQVQSGDLAFWTGVQHATMHMAGKDEPVPMKLRTTEVFRFEDGGWKLIHRHADMAKDKPEH